MILGVLTIAMLPHGTCLRNMLVKVRMCVDSGRDLNLAEALANVHDPT